MEHNVDFAPGPTEAVNGIIAAFASGDQPSATYRALDEAVQRLYGRKFLTILRIESEFETRRVFTTDAHAYPLGEGKAVQKTARSANVIQRGEAFLATTPAEIRDHFAGHALVIELGADSLGNFPALFDGRVVGMVNVGGAGWTEFGEIRCGLAGLVRVIGPVLAAYPH